MHLIGPTLRLTLSARLWVFFFLNHGIECVCKIETEAHQIYIILDSSFFFSKLAIVSGV